MSILAVAAAVFASTNAIALPQGPVELKSAADPVYPASSLLSPADTILVQKQITSKKVKVRLYPSASHEVLFFSAIGPTGQAQGKVYQLYLFDIEGNLVKQANILNKQTTVLNNLEKGRYVFEVFSDDERIENGQLIVR